LVTDMTKFFETLADETRVLDTVVEMTRDAVLVTNSPAAQEFEEVLSNTNVAIAAFTTAQARLKLYSFMEKLQERCLYTDTGEKLFTSKDISY
jgi:hypothetical protein